MVQHFALRLLKSKVNIILFLQIVEGRNIMKLNTSMYFK